MQKKNKIEVVDFIRGYSMLSIVLFHFFQGVQITPLFSKAINFGGSGIHTFLFASGFGLFLSHLGRPLNYPAFLKQRVTKIYIPYILIVTLSAVISIFIPVYANSWNAFFSHVFFYKMFDADLIGTYGYQLWFISTIMQFYLLFPLIVKLREWMPGRRFLAVGLLISFAWGAAILLLHKSDERNWNSFFLAYIWEFMLGMFCADIYIKKGWAFWDIRRIWLLVFAITGISLYGIMALKGGELGKIFNDVPALLGYASLCILIYRLHVMGINRFILFTAKISFALFLIHFLVFNLVREAAQALGWNWSLRMLFPSLILCYLAAVPLQKLFDYITNALLGRRRSVPASIPG